MDTPNFDRISPASCVNAKIRRMHRLLDSIYQKRLKPFGLKGSMLSIMFIVGKNGGMTQKQLAELLALDQSTISRDLKKLKQNGWLLMEKGEDQRFSVLHLSEGGFAHLELVSPVWEKTHHEVEALLGNFSIQQIDSITAAIKTNKENFEKTFI